LTSTLVSTRHSTVAIQLQDYFSMLALPAAAALLVEPKATMHNQRMPERYGCINCSCVAAIYDQVTSSWWRPTKKGLFDVEA
jgi:hypothetical protein